ncbi:MAG TPA: YibE/F family protein [Patescibacteria group bacterium]|nr:YibE/F family protein [Patescibacteria group bacterium]
MEQERMRRDRWFSLLILLLCVLMYAWPGQGPAEDNHWRGKAVVLAVDNSDVHQRGVVQTGVQVVELEVKEGPLKGQRTTTTNPLIGKLEMDKIFRPGDAALAVVQAEENRIVTASVVDHYRLEAEAGLFGVFALALLWYARWTGLKALLSFVFTVLLLWKVLWPLFLQGWNPIPLALLVVCAIVGCVVFLVTGLSRTGLAAFLGTVAAALAVCLLAIGFGSLFKIHGAVAPFSETLLHVGFSQLDLTGIFLAGIFLASTGAMMDVAVDIAAAVAELVGQKPSITREEAIGAGMNIGRAVVGTMTTTLLLAYSGAFTALMMVFLAQGTPVINILNLSYIAAELLHTMVGSCGVVLVAPFTAVLSGYLLVKKEKPDAVQELADTAAK